MKTQRCIFDIYAKNSKILINTSDVVKKTIDFKFFYSAEKNNLTISRIKYVGENRKKYGNLAHQSS